MYVKLYFYDQPPLTPKKKKHRGSLLLSSFQPLCPPPPPLHFSSHPLQWILTVAREAFKDQLQRAECSSPVTAFIGVLSTSRPHAHTQTRMFQGEQCRRTDRSIFSCWDGRSYKWSWWLERKYSHHRSFISQ